MVNTTLKINNKNYILCYDINSLCLMKSEGLDVMKMHQIEMDIITIRALFYYGLVKFHNKPKLTLEKAGDLMSDYVNEGGTFQELTNVMMKALSEGLGLKVEDNNQGE